MTAYTIIHLHNPTAGREEELVKGFDESRDAISALRGFKSAQLFTRSEKQILPVQQPWLHVAFYEFETIEPEIDLPAIAPLFARQRDRGLIANDETERVYSYRMYHPWKCDKTITPAPFTHLKILLANFTPGREAEYHRWYDEVHSVEVTTTPGYVAMRRGRLTDLPIEPRHHCLGSELVAIGFQTDDLGASLDEFHARAMGTSKPEGATWGPRSTSASSARTVHCFESVAGPFGDYSR
ncbi:hypothetical protein [Novosphingobium pentaromativorans]|uniref:EthD domain-containing protein n=1 Tax=Novosphingobium pentaromativorans US6-1 TaxID=1088721 RepID=G6E873_9SPHN|nr:hypothetical protein [Novosphingobium pentaromativorans]EHJ62413.1 hypothetical protein NSU_0544 [Novosphingobium pentaromativorans US6-1]